MKKYDAVGIRFEKSAKSAGKDWGKLELVVYEEIKARDKKR